MRFKSLPDMVCQHRIGELRVGHYVEHAAVGQSVRQILVEPPRIGRMYTERTPARSAAHASAPQDNKRIQIRVISIITWGRLLTCGGLAIRLPGVGASLEVRLQTQRRIDNPPQMPICRTKATVYKGQSITVITPCLNEEQGVEKVLRAMPEFVDEVIVVDNASTDRTSEVAASLGAKVIREGQRGYGRSL